MSVNKQYQANTFLKKLSELESHFEFVSKLYSLNYKDTKKILKIASKDITFYPGFYVSRIKALKNSLKKFFNSFFISFFVSGVIFFKLLISVVSSPLGAIL